MKIEGRATRTIWPTGTTVRVIDQTRLPFEVAEVELRTADDAAHAIRTMIVRGAPLIGATAAYGVALAMAADPSDRNLTAASAMLRATAVAVNATRVAAPSAGESLAMGAASKASRSRDLGAGRSK